MLKKGKSTHSISYYQPENPIAFIPKTFASKEYSIYVLFVLIQCVRPLQYISHVSLLTNLCLMLQFHASRLGYQQSPSYSSPGKTNHPPPPPPHHLQASPRSGFSIPSHRGLNHSAVDASALRPVYRSSQRHDLVTEI